MSMIPLSICLFLIWYPVLQKYLITLDWFTPSSELITEVSKAGTLSINEITSQQITTLGRVLAHIFSFDLLLFNIFGYAKLLSIMIPYLYLAIVFLSQEGTLILFYLVVRKGIFNAELRRKILIESRVFRFIKNVWTKHKLIMVMMFLVYLPYSTKIIVLWIFCEDLIEFLIVTSMSNLILLPLYSSIVDDTNFSKINLQQNASIQNTYSHITFVVTVIFISHIVLQLRDSNNYEYKGRKVIDDWTNYFYNE